MANILHIDITTGEVLLNRYWDYVCQNVFPDDYHEKQYERWREQLEQFSRGPGPREEKPKPKGLVEYYNQLQTKYVGNGRAVTLEELEKMLGLHREGYLLTHIAKALGRHRVFVREHLLGLKEAGENVKL
jgi:hypothetical protein